ncbi:Peptidase-M3 domain-containing protein [Spirobacillus cienkowskii]
MTILDDTQMPQSYPCIETKKRIFLKPQFNPLKKSDVKELLKQLLNEVPVDFKSAATWFGLFHEASCAISEVHSQLELNLSFNVQDHKAELQLKEFEENILSELLSVRSALMDIYMSSPWRNSMHFYDNDRILKDLSIRKIYTNKEITLLQIEENQLIRDYKKFAHTAKTHFEGRSVLVSSVIGKMNDPDLNTRKSAFFAYWNFVKANEEKYQSIFESLLINRRKQAEVVNAKSYVDIAFSELGRIDYGVAECSQFRQSILQEVIPVIKNLSKLQQESLNEDSISPWDISIWPDLMPKKSPANGNLNELVASVQNITSKIHPAFGKLFHEMRKKNLIDIFPRKGKAPGAFCVTFQESGYPFVFGNFSGTFKDALTFLHEFGHAIHGYAVSNIQNVLLRHPGFEFCEVASIGFELLASRFFSDLWVNKEDSTKALAFHFFNMLHFWPFMAMIDEWQHVIYTCKDLPSAEQRNKIWLDISRKYRPHVNWCGFEDLEELGWVSRPHIFTSPFYYIDYGIAQSGAIQLWKKSKVNFAETVNNYIAGLSLGAQKSLPDLFEATGLKFDFSRKMMKNLCEDIQEEIMKVSAK